MRRLIKLSISLFLLSLITTYITACQKNTTGSNIGDQTATEISKNELSTQTASIIDTDIADVTEFEEIIIQEISFNADEHIELCSLEIKSGEQIYEIKVFIYDRIGETDNEARGDAAFELYKNGERVNTIAPIIGYIGQRGKTYVKNKSEDYFNVIKLDGGEVFAVTYPEDNGLSTTVFCTVRDGELTLMERYYTEEERQRLELDDPHWHPITEKTCFNTTNKFSPDGNTLVFELSSEISDNDNTFPAGEIPLVFDFENNTVKCDKDEYAGMVYYS